MPKRLKSRRPVCNTAVKLLSEKFYGAKAWRETWATQKVDKRNLVQDPNGRPLGFDLNRKAWVALNRFRTGHGRNDEYYMTKWENNGRTSVRLWGKKYKL